MLHTCPNNFFSFRNFKDGKNRKKHEEVLHYLHSAANTSWSEIQLISRRNPKKVAIFVLQHCSKNLNMPTFEFYN